MLRIQAGGKRRDVGLRSAATVTLKEARDKADELRKLYQRCTDPLADRKAAKLATATIPTFRDAAAIAHGEHEGDWRNVKHRADWLSSLERYAFPAIGDTRVDLIDAPTVRDLLLPIWLERPETARRVRQRVKLVLDWAAAKGYRPALDLSGIAKALLRQPKKESHFAAMSYEQVPAFVASLGASGETVSRLALQLLILTAARSGKLRGAKWPEIDLEAHTWTIPGSRMKAGKELDSRFPFGVQDWAVEATSFPDAVSEAALAHIDANKVRAAYSRTDFRKQRTDLMAAWANFIGDGSATVEALRTAKGLAA